MTTLPLGELLEISDSGVWGDEDAQNGISVLRSTNFNADGSLDLGKLTFRVLDERHKVRKLLRPGDILLEKSGGGPKQPVGRVCLYRGDERPHAFGNFIARLRPGSDVLSKYLFYYLWLFHSTGRTSHYQKQTTGIRNLEFKRYLTIPVPLRALDEQRRIVDLLSRAEGIVRLRREAQAKAQAIIPALFLDMFGDPKTNLKGWTELPLRVLVEGFRYGTSNKSGATGLPTLRIPNVIGDRLDPKDMKLVTVTAAEVTRLRLLAGDLLFVRTNGNPDYVGRSAVFEPEVMSAAGVNATNCIYASYLIRARLKPDAIRPGFLQSFLSSHEGRKRLREQARASAGQYNINTEGLGSIHVPLPSAAMQMDFEERCCTVLGIVAQQTEALKKAEATFQALLARAFNSSSYK